MAQSASEWLWGSAPELQKKATGSKTQQQFGAEDLIKMLQNMMDKGGGLDQANQYDQSLLSQKPQSFEEFSQPYQRQFNEQLLPEIENRYARHGLLSSSAFGQAVGGAASGFQSELAKLFSQLQDQFRGRQGEASSRQQGLFQNSSQTGLNYEPFAYHEKQGSTGFVVPFATALATKAMPTFGA